MKRSLTIGCVLLVGGGVANCGGSVAGVTVEEQPGQSGASGSGAAGAGVLGLVEVSNNAGGGGVYLGSSIGVAGASGNGPAIDSAGSPGEMMGAGAAGWEPGVGGDGPIAGAGGESGSSDEPPAVGTAPLGGTGGWIGIPAK